MTYNVFSGTLNPTQGTTPKIKIGRSTDGGCSGMKFFKIIYFNMEPRLNTYSLHVYKI